MNMPVIFSGHGSPMIALENNIITQKLDEIGKYVIEKYGKPKAILMISAHWTKNGNYTQSEEMPRQIYDMYGFPQKLYEVKYPVKGNMQLTNELEKIGVKIDNSWGIDHGAWSILIHMFPNADIPVVQLSVNNLYNVKECYEFGKSLKKLRSEGYLIIGSGNIVHNLACVNWYNRYGSTECIAFDNYIKEAVLGGKTEKVFEYENNEFANYAVPTTEHFMPLLYCMGASEGSKAKIFNNIQKLGSISMTGYIFEDE